MLRFFSIYMYVNCLDYWRPLLPSKYNKPLYVSYGTVITSVAAHHGGAPLLDTDEHVMKG